MKTRQVLALCALLLLPGCESLQLFKSAAADKGAAAVDTVRDDAEFVMCRGITVGSWIRRYGNSPKQAGAWRTLCGETLTETPK